MHQKAPAPKLRMLTAALAVAICALTAATVVHAANEDWVYYTGPLNPGGYYTTPNENYRLYNEACRDGNSGQMSVQYLYSGQITADSGSQWTNCQTGAIVKLTGSGTYQSRCKNTGTVQFNVVCQTTRPV